MIVFAPSSEVVASVLLSMGLAVSVIAEEMALIFVAAVDQYA